MQVLLDRNAQDSTGSLDFLNKELFQDGLVHAADLCEKRLQKQKKQKTNETHSWMFRVPWLKVSSSQIQVRKINNNIFWQMIVLFAVWVLTFVINNVNQRSSCTIVQPNFRENVDATYCYWSSNTEICLQNNFPSVEVGSRN